MLLKHENTFSSDSLKDETQLPINLICVFRDEAILLPHFIDYYKKLGVTHFYFIDNNSIDSSSDYLIARKDINLKLFFTEQSYRTSIFGTKWQNEIMAKFCQNQYCLRVDSDELLLLDPRRHGSLAELIKELDSKNKTAVPAILLDIYPEKLTNDYQAGQEFSDYCFYFDKLNQDYYRARSVIFKSFYWLEGGLRARTLNTYNAIQKFPIVRSIFNNNTVQPSPHFFSLNSKDRFTAPIINLHEFPVILLHYKFIKPDFLAYLQKQIENDEHWNGSIEYKNYYNTLKEKNEISFYERNYSQKFDAIEDLDAFWNINQPLLTRS